MNKAEKKQLKKKGGGGGSRISIFIFSGFLVIFSVVYNKDQNRSKSCQLPMHDDMIRIH